MHPEERGLLDDIIANPDDDGPRLIYADWLGDHGRPDRADEIYAAIADPKSSRGFNFTGAEAPSHTLGFASWRGFAYTASGTWGAWMTLHALAFVARHPLEKGIQVTDLAGTMHRPQHGGHIDVTAGGNRWILTRSLWQEEWDHSQSVYSDNEAAEFTPHFIAAVRNPLTALGQTFFDALLRWLRAKEKAARPEPVGHL